MPDTKKNALAELAERLSSNKVELVEGANFRYGFRVKQ